MLYIVYTNNNEAINIEAISIEAINININIEALDEAINIATESLFPQNDISLLGLTSEVFRKLLQFCSVHLQ